ncbi:hypothetical protein [Mesorhizobium sp. L-8-3]|uniref:hypothetical protein n=1 Tax=Mesorhizobium sp. L-8-3 TaxID=2744522 RepID=UPI00192590CF|nr:hypothetical protein [Mesorhizobium sp. L-8-3]BCH22820.1 hypothetical protein MesoLjLb_26050 [Mesorhizobium sp. L-8-3]
MLPVQTIFSLDQGKIYSPPQDEFVEQGTSGAIPVAHAESCERDFWNVHLLDFLLPSKARGVFRIFGSDA